jgi:ABC-2 type transport system ATP-binding protein
VKRFGSLTAVNGLDIELERGICLALLGPNGAGKTTTIEMLEGLTRPDAGTIEILGRSWATDADEIRVRIGVQLPETRLQEKVSVLETLRLFRSFYREGRDLAHVLEIVGLTDKGDARVETLSGGQHQRLSLACALVSNPELLFLDEPTTGLDPQARRRVWEIVDGFKSEGGTILLTTHYMEEAEKLADAAIAFLTGQAIDLGARGIDKVYGIGLVGEGVREGREDVRTLGREGR